jgi:hypothetical protein
MNLKELSSKAFWGMLPVLWKKMKEKANQKGDTSSQADAECWIQLLTEAEIASALYEELRNQAFNVANGFFGKDFVSQSIQNDWQRLLDAADTRNLSILSTLQLKYKTDEQRDGLGSGTSGAGPGKVKQARRGAAQLARFAREIQNAIQFEAKLTSK